MTSNGGVIQLAPRCANSPHTGDSPFDGVV